jgi:hypothetical protein
MNSVLDRMAIRKRVTAATASIIKLKAQNAR